MSENAQKAHYEAIHDSYEQHYYDQTALDYRKRFVVEPLLRNIDLSGMRIADLACGSGWNTILLRDRLDGASFHGFDISNSACEDYRKNTGFPATCCDVSAMNFGGEPFDAVIVIGGLHHMVNDLESSAKTIAQMLKPDGRLLAYEPNAEFFLNNIREFWYRKDQYFEEETERPLTLNELQDLFAGQLKLTDAAFLGGPAYFLILNSLVTRVPLPMKKPMAGLLSAMESVYNKLPGQAPFPAFTSRWQKQ